jgi:hypothetical protein
MLLFCEPVLQLASLFVVLATDLISTLISAEAIFVAGALFVSFCYRFLLRNHVQQSSVAWSPCLQRPPAPCDSTEHACPNARFPV